ncbi:FAD-dependent oxidoreductase [Fictibacillus sp. FJAT-27399]|uniref:FAD-dependent oxidoreductase n=1 Tax=Fictibacillus sp. FJAT-27399 TaxID=1729689 RepID=UPI00078279F3|nr:FAD-dependent oxidoreductase [Fictibacillus sp. FJAT-27399]
MRILNYDVVCIGSGVAGMMASIAAAHEGARVCIITKEPLSWGNTRISGGIIADRGSDGDDLYRDMLEAGAYLNQDSLVEALLENSENIHFLMEGWGHLYLRSKENPREKITIKPGGHSMPRTYISHHRGLSLANILRNKLLEKKIDVVEEAIACDWIKVNKKICGLIAYNWGCKEWIGVIAGQTILACGGAGIMYNPYTDNMRSATGDGYALGLLAGAKLIDMEQVQFMPFGVSHPNGMVGLELGDTSAAGPYGVLKNNKGEVIVTDLPNKTREHVSRIIALEVKQGRGTSHGGVWLDPTENRKHLEGQQAWENWKSIGSLEPLRMAYGPKSFQWLEPFEVTPTQHYMMGGIAIDKTGSTKVPGLMAVGENAGGLHGAGRMGSLSLFEGLVFGRLVGREAARKAYSIEKLSHADLVEQKQQMYNLFPAYHEDLSPARIKRKIGKIMWRDVGILRDREGLERAYQQLEDIGENIQKTKQPYHKREDFLLLESIELQFLLLASRAVTLSALHRQESRGSHYRIDYPVSQTHWERKNITVRFNRDDWQVEVLEG